MAKSSAPRKGAKKPPTKKGKQPSAVSIPIDPKAQVVQWLVAGQSDSDIREAVRNHWPNADPDSLLLAATDHFEAASECELSVIVGWALEAYRDLYRRQLAIGDFDGARKALKELVALAARHGNVHDPERPGESESNGKSESTAD